MIKNFLMLAMIVVPIAVANTAHAFPDRPMTVVVPFGAGTSVDINGRDFAQAFGTVITQPVVVDNRPGAEGTIGGLAVLCLSNFATIREFGYLAAATMFVCLVTDLLMTPALLVRGRI